MPFDWQRTTQSVQVIGGGGFQGATATLEQWKGSRDEELVLTNQEPSWPWEDRNAAGVIEAHRWDQFTREGVTARRRNKSEIIN